jgi:predicted RNase H-like nuclease (RuvC/YqgF family)
LKKTQTKLAGAEYDLRFVVKSLENEQAKAKEAKNLEQLSKAKRYEANVKRLKIDVLKRRGTIKSVQNEIKKLENIISERAKEIGELEELVEKIVVEQKEQKKKKSKNKSQEEEMRDELVRQHHNKEEEILQSRKHMQDLLADAGEDLYRIRIRHPVLEKYYAELDRVTKKIKEFEK